MTVEVVRSLRASWRTVALLTQCIIKDKRGEWREHDEAYAVSWARAEPTMSPLHAPWPSSCKGTTSL